MALDRLFLKTSIEELNQLAGRFTDCLGRLTTEQVWARGGENENAMGNLALHLCGNVRQWIISGVGGRADVRDRDSEFAARGGASPQELAAMLRQTVAEAVAVLESVTAERLEQQLRIQGYEVTGMSAIYHVVQHFGQHTGQIIFATKQLTGQDLGYFQHLSRAAQAEKAQ